MNSFLNVAETLGNYLHILPNNKQKFSILSDVSGIIKPGRYKFKNIRKCHFPMSFLCANDMKIQTKLRP
ncbi:hypothetical protein Lalb_Chr11g0071991 [Lupinus albus]|uniref:Uncharacterized protein n=1 Tax=Lupinus albus TaxID=3870 RepID=A0A6A4PSD1_LUPAL|nr:hypothetical protein Lalb_Chr11g0071991 [Lupinus albus]